MTRRPPIGQHFLSNRYILDRIAAFARLEGKERVLEIGAGRGALTRRLARVLSGGGHLTALEIDPDLVSRLKREFAEVPHVEVLQANALSFDFASLGPGITVIGNLPYYAATGILLRLLPLREAVDKMIFMLQREVAQRLSAQPGRKAYGTLSIAVQLWNEVVLGFDVPPKAFSPPPRVSSTVIRITPRRAPRVPLKDPDLFDQVLRASFSQRRKTLLNNLKVLYPRWAATGELAEAIREAGVDPRRRAETLGIEEFAHLSECLGSLSRGPKREENSIPARGSSTRGSSE